MIDVWGYIIRFIKSNKDKCRLMMTCKGITKCHFIFDEIIKVKKIAGSRWFNKFNNIITNSDLPSLPLFVTHLTFNWKCNKPINGNIPSSVTHLAFGDCFNQPINNCIPPSVTHLVFCWDFNQPIDNCIPSSVTHLVFCNKFNQPVKNNIPESVINLTFRFDFYYGKNCYIPPTVITINVILFDEESDFIIQRIPHSVKEINFFYEGWTDCEIPDVKKQYVRDLIGRKDIILNFHGELFNPFGTK